MTIEILCSGCDNCEIVLGRVCQALSDLNLEAEIVSIYDPVRLAENHIYGEAGVVIDGHLVNSGDQTTSLELKHLINEKLNHLAAE